MNQKSVTTNQKAVSDVISVVVMVAIILALAAAVNISMNGMSSSRLNPAPFVSMMQSDDDVLIIAIQNGPIEIAGTKIIIEDSSGNPAGSASFNTLDTCLKGGDIIKIDGVTPGEGYTVSIIYSNSIVGQIVYIA